MNRTLLLAGEEIRKREGLLSPADVLRIRERFQLSQAQFETLLGIGPKTVGRWERGTVFPSRTADTLLRLIDEDPRIAWKLAARNGIEIPVEPVGRTTYTYVEYLTETMVAMPQSNLGQAWPELRSWVGATRPESPTEKEKPTHAPSLALVA